MYNSRIGSRVLRSASSLMWFPSRRRSIISIFCMGVIALLGRRSKERKALRRFTFFGRSSPFLGDRYKSALCYGTILLSVGYNVGVWPNGCSGWIRILLGTENASACNIFLVGDRPSPLLACLLWPNGRSSLQLLSSCWNELWIKLKTEVNSHL